MHRLQETQACSRGLSRKWLRTGWSRTSGNVCGGYVQALIGEASPHIDHQADGHQALGGKPNKVAAQASGYELPPGLEAPALLGAHCIHIAGWMEMAVSRASLQAKQGGCLHEGWQAGVHVEGDCMDLEAAADGDIWS